MIRELFGQLALHLLLLMALAAVPLVLLARRRVYPHTSLVAILLAPCLLALLLVAVPEFLLIVMLVDAAVAVLAVADLFTLPRASAFSAQRELERIASLGKPHDVQLTVVNHRQQPVHLWIRDDVPESLEAAPARVRTAHERPQPGPVAVPAQADTPRRVRAGLRPLAHSQPLGILATLRVLSRHVTRCTSIPTWSS